jgi:hypothetical protein
MKPRNLGREPYASGTEFTTEHLDATPGQQEKS